MLIDPTIRPAAPLIGRSQRGWSRLLGVAGLAAALAALAALAGCVSPPPATVAPAPVVAVAPTPPVEPPIAPTAAPEPVVLPAPIAVAPPVVVAPKEPPPVELPNYAKRGKRLPTDGGPAGRAVLAYCRSFEIDKDAASHFKRLQKQNQLPSENDVAERNRQNESALTQRQMVERDWLLRRDNNKSVPQRCKVLGGSAETATAYVVFEADLHGRRQRGTATVTLTNDQWRLRDHGGWLPVSTK
jgi:hypothetical protein